MITASSIWMPASWGSHLVDGPGAAEDGFVTGRVRPEWSSLRLLANSPVRQQNCESSGNFL